MTILPAVVALPGKARTATAAKAITTSTPATDLRLGGKSIRGIIDMCIG